MSEVAYIEDIIFMNKQNIPWSQVEQYLKQYIGCQYVVANTKDVINIGSDFPEEFAESTYTKSLRGNLSKAKANAARGWYRYDSYFAMPVKGSDEDVKRINLYKATLVVRNSLSGLYLYDVINIKKEASTPHGL